MVGNHRILAITSQPGDESWAFGAVLARYAAEGVRVHLVCATLGESGQFGASRRAFPPAVLGRMRERELDAAADLLGIHETELLRYSDGAVAAADPFRLQMELAARIRRIRPQVVVTLGPQGPDGDRDRVALAEATPAAILVAARHSAPVPGGSAPHAVRKVYQRVWSGQESVFGPPAAPSPSPHPELVSPPLPPRTPDWMINTVVDTHEYAGLGQEALACHRSRPFRPTSTPRSSILAPEAVWRRAEFIRSLSTVAVPEGVEKDLLAGIRRVDLSSARAA